MDEFHWKLQQSNILGRPSMKHAISYVKLPTMTYTFTCIYTVLQKLNIPFKMPGYIFLIGIATTWYVTYPFSVTTYALFEMANRQQIYNTPMLTGRFFFHQLHTLTCYFFFHAIYYE